MASIHSRITITHQDDLGGTYSLFLAKCGVQTTNDELNFIGNMAARLTENKHSINNATVTESVEFNKGNEFSSRYA
jgi:hypothetical protein